MTLKQNNSSFVTYDLSPGIDTNNNVSEAVKTMGSLEGTLHIQNEDKSMKTNFIYTRFGKTIGTLRFDEKIFF